MQDQSASSRLLDHDALDAGEWSLEYPGSMSDRDSLVLVDRHAMIDRGMDRRHLPEESCLIWDVDELDHATSRNRVVGVLVLAEYEDVARKEWNVRAVLASPGHRDPLDQWKVEDHAGRLQMTSHRLFLSGLGVERHPPMLDSGGRRVS